jgi:hypothetical protein
MMVLGFVAAETQGFISKELSGTRIYSSTDGDAMEKVSFCERWILKQGIKS